MLPLPSSTYESKIICIIITVGVVGCGVDMDVVVEGVYRVDGD